MTTRSPSASPTSSHPSSSPTINVHADVAVLWQCGLALAFALVAFGMAAVAVYVLGFGTNRLLTRVDLLALIPQGLLFGSVLALVLTPQGATPGVASNLGTGSTAADLGIAAIAIGGTAFLGNTGFLISWSLLYDTAFWSWLPI